jgi:hypothetical protein
MLDFYANAGYVTLIGVPRQQLDGNSSSSTVVDFSGYVDFSDAMPPAFQEVQALEKALLLDLSGVQAAVESNSAIGENVRVEQVVAGNNSAVALSDFTTFVTADSNNGTSATIDEAQNPR